MKPHVLPAEQEELLTAAGELAGAPGNIFRMFNNADLRFPEIPNEEGEMVELSHGRYIKFLESQDPKVREAAVKAMYETYSAWKNTLGATYTAAVKKELYFSRARKYNSSLEAALFTDNVDPEVYTNLIQTVHEHLHLLHRYVRCARSSWADEMLCGISMCPWWRWRKSRSPGSRRCRWAGCSPWASSTCDSTGSGPAGSTG